MSSSPWRMRILTRILLPAASCPLSAENLRLTIVFDIDSLDNKNHGLGYVGGEVGTALEATRDDDGIYCPIHRLNFADHIVDKMSENLQIKLVRRVIHLANF